MAKKSAQTATTLKYSNVRKSPEIKRDNIIRTAQKGEALKVKGIKADWCELEDGSYILKELVDLGGTKPEAVDTGATGDATEETAQSTAEEATGESSEDENDG